MRSIVRYLSSKSVKEILPNSKIRIFRPKKYESTTIVQLSNSKQTDKKSVIKPNNTKKACNEYRENEMKIQMLSMSLYNQLFPKSVSNHPTKLSDSRIASYVYLFLF